MTSPDASPRPQRAAAWTLVGILVLALALRLPHYTQSVWIDELFTSDIFCGDTVVLLKTLFSDIHPPAYFVFIHLWNGAFGDGEVFLRLPPLLCGLASILVMARLGELFAGRGAGLMAAFLLAVSPVHVWYSREARPYSTNLLLILLAVLAFHRLHAAPRSTRWTVVYALSLFGAVFTHYYMATFLFVFAGLALVQRSPAARRVVWIDAAILAVLAVYMGAKSYLSQVPTSKGYLRPFDTAEAWDLGFNWFLTGNSLTPIGETTTLGVAVRTVLQVLAVVVFVRGLVRLVGTAPSGTWHGLALPIYLLTLPAFLLVLNVIGLDQTYIERSALPALPFFVLILAAGLTGQRSALAARATLAGTVAAATVVLYSFFAQPDSWTVYKPKPDWRSAAAHLGAWLDEQGDEKRHLLLSAYVSPTALTYYDPRIQESKQFERNDAKLERLLTRSGEVFGTEGFPGGWIQEFARERFAEYERTLAEAEAGTRIAVKHLPYHDPFDPADPAPAEFWLLVHRDPDDAVRRLLTDERVRVLEERRFRSLALYRLRKERT